ncbi:uncharacterized protein Bfra_010999 [Botrytis fragariae]|uniref:Uncharacterized protein n=1 Tax=Botrytis fragariae TaxID=1964551 RepID=A0A8H6ALV7_9HELO|nr:uncharacterized protein Bfra_010999 [Botrytis fragariae]KAF5869799.1 hypothetical protein Bfra_010999 [Botrytis fragariae]
MGIPEARLPTISPFPSRSYRLDSSKQTERSIVHPYQLISTTGLTKGKKLDRGQNGRVLPTQRINAQPKKRSNSGRDTIIAARSLTISKHKYAAVAEFAKVAVQEHQDFITQVISTDVGRCQGRQISIIKL